MTDTPEALSLTDRPWAALSYDPADPDKMRLPAGATCGDCARWSHCKAFIGSLKPSNTRCDWSPSCFMPVATGRAAA